MKIFKQKKFLIFVGFCTFFYFFVDECNSILSEKSDYTVIDSLPQLDCGVVLTGGVGRIRESFEILAQKKIKKLVISGVYKETQLREIFPQLPFYPEINTENIILEKKSESTFGNAIQSLALIKNLKCKNLLLITSELHMYRAYKIFRYYFPNSVEITKYAVAGAQKENKYFDIALEGFKSVFYSAFGRAL